MEPLTGAVQQGLRQNPVLKTPVWKKEERTGRRRERHKTKLGGQGSQDAKRAPWGNASAPSQAEEELGLRTFTVPNQTTKGQAD